MKKLLFPLLAACLLLASCDIVEFKNSGSFSESEPQWGEVSFALADGPASVATRSTTQASESEVNSLQILIYNSTGNLVAYASGTSGTLSAKVPLNVSGHVVYAVTNVSEDLSLCSTPSDLTSKISYLRDNSLNGLQMIGSVDNQTFTSGSTVSVEVRRFAAKVEIDQIVTEFTAASFRSQPFVVTGIYLINVNGSCPFSQVATSGTWYNQMQYVSGECNALIADKFNTPVTIQNASGQVTPYTRKHYFYCYPNPTTTDAHRGSWSPRRTRLVVETQLGERVYYYPIDIVGTGNKLNMNTFYLVTKLTITGPGADHPDDLLDNGTVSFTVTVTDWENGFTKEVTY